MIEIQGDGWVGFTFDQAVDLPVYLVGDFNGWNEASHLMAHQENGTYRVELRLNPGEYEFKYKCGSIWFNDSCAHKYVENCWGSENSVVVVPPIEEGASVGPGERADQLASSGA